tara:strand:+ start:777 stop:1352 length:576 start_codon:yes stop_codon:yes gene_type:complete
MEKTNYLFFRQKGSQTFTATASQTDFTLADDGSGNFDQDFSDASNNEAHIEVTSNGTIVGAGDRSFATNVVTLASAATVGDIVIVTAVPREGTEASFRADRFLGVRTTSDTVTTINFKAGDDQSFATTNDELTLTHNSNADAARLIASAMEEAINSETGTGFVDVLDREAGTGVLTKTGLTFSNLQLSIQA